MAKASQLAAKTGRDYSSFSETAASKAVKRGRRFGTALADGTERMQRELLKEPI